MYSPTVEKLLTAIKKNDLATYLSLVKEEPHLKNISFGRFPLLSLCYLYGSNRIARVIENDDRFTQEHNYHVVDDDYEAYLKFKKIAGKSLRLYLGGKIVTPPEMLAIINDVTTLKENYNKYPRSEKNKERLSKIFALRYDEKVTITDKSITCHRGRLPKIQTVIICVMLSFVLVFSGFTGMAIAFSKIRFGEGTIDSPYLIHNENQLKLAIDKKLEYSTLEEDITISSDNQFSDFNFNLDGKGHTITLSSERSNPLFDKLYGSISNVNFNISGNPTAPLFDELYGNISNINLEVSDISILVSSDSKFLTSESDGRYSFGYLIKSNYGTIKNLSASFSGTITDTIERTNNVGGNTYYGMLVGINKGTVDSIRIDSEINIVGNDSGSTCFSLGVGSNYSKISEITIIEGSRLSSQNADVCGIVASSEFADYDEEGITLVSGCSNHATIEQTISGNNVMPCIGGIAIFNSANMEDCINYGKLSTVVSSKGQRVYVHSAGISSYNYYVVKKSANYGEITITAQQDTPTYIYCGGVIGESSAELNVIPEINNCINNADISVTAYSTASITSTSTYTGQTTTGTYGNFLFVGGIVGYLYGSVHDSYSLGTGNVAFSDSVEQTIYHEAIYGSFSGIFITDYNYFGWYIGAYYITNLIFGNYALYKENVSYAFASHMYLNTTNLQAGDNINTTVLNTIEEITIKESYWA